MQNYGYNSAYQAENDRKRQLDYDDQGNDDLGFSMGKRQKAEGKKKVLFPLQCNGIKAYKCKIIVSGCSKTSL